MNTISPISMTAPANFAGNDFAANLEAVAATTAIAEAHSAPNYRYAATATPNAMTGGVDISNARKIDANEAPGQGEILIEYWKDFDGPEKHVTEVTYNGQLYHFGNTKDHGFEGLNTYRVVAEGHIVDGNGAPISQAYQFTGDFTLTHGIKQASIHPAGTSGLKD